MSLDKKEIKKILEFQTNEKRCILEKYEAACGMWCEFKQCWCEDMSGENKKNTCSNYTPIPSIETRQSILDLLEEYETEIKKLKEEREFILKYHPTTIYSCQVSNPYGVFFCRKEEDYEEFKRNVLGYEK